MSSTTSTLRPALQGLQGVPADHPDLPGGGIVLVALEADEVDGDGHGHCAMAPVEGRHPVEEVREEAVAALEHTDGRERLVLHRLEDVARQPLGPVLYQSPWDHDLLQVLLIVPRNADVLQCVALVVVLDLDI